MSRAGYVAALGLAAALLAVVFLVLDASEGARDVPSAATATETCGPSERPNIGGSEEALQDRVEALAPEVPRSDSTAASEVRRALDPK